MISSLGMGMYKFNPGTNSELTGNVPWKAQVFKQMVPSLQMNATALKDPTQNYHDNTLRGTGIGSNVLLPQPLKIYRKEIATNVVTAPTQPRTGLTIDSINMPGSLITIHATTTVPPGGLDAITVNRKDVGETNNLSDHPGKCASFTTNGICLDPETNARRRCRTSGIVKKNYNTSSQQYLNSRNKTFQQNQYQYLQSGNAAATPGTAAANKNTYVSQSSPSSWEIYTPDGTLSTCGHGATAHTDVYYKPNNPKFSSQGAVESSARTLRSKFDTITNNVAMYRKNYGNSVADAMGYGISDSVYTYKDKVGFPLKKTPVLGKYKMINNCCTHVAPKVL